MEDNTSCCVQRRQDSGITINQQFFWIRKGSRSLYTNVVLWHLVFSCCCHQIFETLRLCYFKIIGMFHIKFLKNGVWYGKSYYRLLIGNHRLAFDWCHFWWNWSTFEGHFSLGCHFHVHFSNPWHAFASHCLPAIAELLVRPGNESPSATNVVPTFLFLLL